MIKYGINNIRLVKAHNQIQVPLEKFFSSHFCVVYGGGVEVNIALLI